MTKEATLLYIFVSASLLVTFALGLSSLSKAIDKRNGRPIGSVFVTVLAVVAFFAAFYVPFKLLAYDLNRSIEFQVHGIRMCAAFQNRIHGGHFLHYPGLCPAYGSDNYKEGYFAYVIVDDELILIGNSVSLFSAFSVERNVELTQAPVRVLNFKTGETTHSFPDYGKLYSYLVDIKGFDISDVRVISLFSEIKKQNKSFRLCGFTNQSTCKDLDNSTRHNIDDLLTCWRMHSKQCHGKKIL